MNICLGHISKTRFWLSFEFKSYNYDGYHLPYIGKTYNGTKRGFVWVLGRLVIMGHEREWPRGTRGGLKDELA